MFRLRGYNLNTVAGHIVVERAVPVVGLARAARGVFYFGFSSEDISLTNKSFHRTFAPPPLWS
jgi:hypothetical protein